MQGATSAAESSSPQPNPELMAPFPPPSQPTPQSRAPIRPAEPASVPTVLQPQVSKLSSLRKRPKKCQKARGLVTVEYALGLLAQGLNVGDSHTQAHLLHILQQIGGSAWPASSQPASSHSLENLLSQISRQPEIAATIPTLLSQLGSSSQQKSLETAPNTDVAPSNFTNSLNFASSGLEDAELKNASQELHMGLDDDPKISSVKCAKEKNRQAQRRFRERQKGLIHNLKEKAETLAKQVEEQRRQIEALEKENNIMRVLLQEKSKT